MLRVARFLSALVLAGCATTTEPPPAGPQGPQVIQIVAGTYGGNCNAPHGNKTEPLQKACSGRLTCAYKVLHTEIGDPIYGCNKDYVAEWRCGADPAVRKATAAPEAGYGSVVELRCN